MFVQHFERQYAIVGQGHATESDGPQNQLSDTPKSVDNQGHNLTRGFLRSAHAVPWLVAKTQCNSTIYPGGQLCPKIFPKMWRGLMGMRCGGMPEGLNKPSYQHPSLPRFTVRDVSVSESALVPSCNQVLFQANGAFYIDHVTRDLNQIVECVVPVGRQGLPNLMSTKQILQNWRMKRVIDPQKVDDVMQILSTRQNQATEASIPGPVPPLNKTSDSHLSRGEIFKRIEEDRERHKRLRERRWVQTQAQSLPSSTVSRHAVTYNPYGLASFLPLSDTENAEVALDIEFENDWEATSDWNEDDVEAIVEERELCYPHLRKIRWGGPDGTDIDGGGGEEPMDLS